MHFFTKIKQFKLIKAILIIVGLLISVCSISFIQDDFEAFLKKLTQYLAHNVNEKVYLHLDKPYYAVGDDIWFKAYVTTTDEKGLSDLSKILYVELIDENSQIVNSVKLPITGGVAWGDFQLNDKLEEGNYRIRAYTQYMRNFDDIFFFNKSILIGKAWSNQIFLNTAFDYDRSNGKIQAASQFLDEKKQPIAKMSVFYQVEIDGKTVSKSNTKTDEKGNLKFNVNFKEGKTGIVTYQFSDSNGRNYTRYVPLNNQWKKQIQFFPEGGDLVLNLQSVVAFKATNASGKGVKVKGKIVDQEGEELATFEDLHLGMGQFNLTPEQGKIYIAQVTFEDGSQQNVPLPEIKTDGVILHILQQIDEPNFQLQILPSPSFINQPIRVIGRKNNSICYASKTVLNKSGILAKIPKEKFPAGIVTFTVLDQNNMPIAERIVFNKQSSASHKLKALNLKSDYEVKEKMNLEFELEGTDEKSVASYSVAVTNSDIVKPDLDNESNILTYEWLIGDLRGFVEKPNYYLNTTDEKAQEALDNLLLTQGWRNFDWKLVRAGIDSTRTFPIEKSIVLQGKVMRGKKPVANGRITIFSNTRGVFIVDTATNEKGEFELSNLVFADTTKFLVQARTEKNKKFVDITINNLSAAPVSYNYQNANNVLNVNNFIESYVDQSQKHFDVLTARGFLQKTIVLEGVTVVGQREEDKPSEWNFAGGYDYIMKREDLQNCFSLLQCLQGRVPGLMVKNNQFYLLRNGDIPMQIILDGMQVESSFLSNIVPQNLKSVEVLTNPSKTTVYGSGGLGGVLILTSLRGTDAFVSNVSPPGLAFSNMRGYSLVRNFYEPSYDGQNTKDDITDGRITVFWKPDLVSTQEGKFSLSYHNADVPANYRIVIEGMDINGNLIREQFVYKVN